MRLGIDRRAMTALSTGHLAVDFAGGAIPALLPFFKDRFGLSYTLVAVIVLASTVSSSVIQPLFGLWSDRRGAIWLLSAGVAVGGVGIALAAAAPAYGLVVVCVIVSGLGTAAFHPEGSKFAAYASGDRRASGMSLFSVGGNIGYALGALVTTPIVIALGLTGGLLLMVPGLVVAGMLLRVVPHLLSLEPSGAERGTVAASTERERPGALTLLLVIVALRSVAWFGLLTFVPLWEASLGNSKSYGSHLLSLMLVTGAVGTLFAGPAADRIGRRPVLMASNIVVPPAILVFVLVGGVPGALALCVVGPAVVGTFGVTMVMSQEYLPRHIGLASGLSIGLSIGLGGVAAVILGAVADSVDLKTAFYVCAAAPVLGALLTALLPSSRAPRGLSPEMAPS
jgi:FSR family fosmidomycin resistance protein-like MFS transporter